MLFPKAIKPPKTIEELMQRANAIAGESLADLAKRYQSALPSNMLKEKGWIGQFIEWVLGASAGSLPEPDFPHLGVELKTIPINEQGKPLESTYVSVVPMNPKEFQSWDNSTVKKKLSHVLWFPIITPERKVTSSKRLATPMLWQPSENEERILRQDWEETMEKISFGRLGELNAKYGEALQVRPKAANSRVLTEAIDSEGQSTQTLPRGFYLRASFTQKILESYYF